MALKLGWFGYGGGSWEADQYRDIIKTIGWELLTCHEYPNADWSYDKSTISHFLDSVDVVLLTHRERQSAKSTNKLAIAWKHKKPVLVGPRPSYLKYCNEANSIVYENLDQLLEGLHQMEDSNLRSKLAEGGHKTALKCFHPRDLIHKINKVVSSKPKVLAVVPHYMNSSKYLTWAVKSLNMQEGVEVDIKVVSSSPSGPPQIEGESVQLIHNHERKTFSQAVNEGLRLLTDHNYVFIFNDDAILQKNSLEEMTKVVKNSPIILNPWSNCDKGWLHNHNTNFEGTQLVPNMSINSFSNEQLDRFINGKINEDQTLSTNFCAFFSTLMSADTFKKVGYLNEKFKNGGEDADYCYRARKLGFLPSWTRRAYCLHFGGKSRKESESNNPTKHHEEDRFNNDLLKKRWSGKRVAIWTGPAWEKWDLDSYKSRGTGGSTRGGIGGSETCAGRLAETLASKGYVVDMYGAHDTKVQNFVNLFPWDHFKPDQEYYDLFIASRNPNCIDHRLKAKKVLLWVHDIFALGTKEFDEGLLNQIDKIICLSPWHKKFFSEYHRVSEEKIDIIPNGLNVELFRDI